MAIISTVLSCLLLCSLPYAIGYRALSNVTLRDNSILETLIPHDTCPYTMFVFYPPDNYSLLDAEKDVLAAPFQICLEPDQPINNSTMITHDYGDYPFSVFSYIIDDTACGRPNLTMYLPVICAYEENDTSTIEEDDDYEYNILPTTATALVFYSLAILASLFTILTYSLFNNLRTLPGQTVLNLAVAFFASDSGAVIFNAKVYNEIDPNPYFYIFLLGLFHARFIWMAIVGFELTRHIYKGMMMKFDDQTTKRKVLGIYIAIGWGVPVLLGIVSMSVEASGVEAERSVRLFSARGYVMQYVPQGLALLFNLAIAIFLVFILKRAAKHRSQLSSANKGKTTFSRLFIVILTVLGYTWFIVFILASKVAHINHPLIYITIVLNVSQPIFVCIAFLGNKKTFQQYAGLFGCREESHPHPLRRNINLLLFRITGKKRFTTLKRYSTQGSRIGDSKLSGRGRTHSVLTYMSSVGSRLDFPLPLSNRRKDSCDTLSTNSDSSDSAIGPNGTVPFHGQVLRNFSLPLANLPESIEEIAEIGGECDDDDTNNSPTPEVNTPTEKEKEEEMIKIQEMKQTDMPQEGEEEKCREIKDGEEEDEVKLKEENSSTELPNTSETMQ